VAYRPEFKACGVGHAPFRGTFGVGVDFPADFTISLPLEVDNHFMSLAVLFIRLLEVMFFVGLAGSAVVVLISFFEDFKELFGED
jgi:hypothetical protein